MKTRALLLTLSCALAFGRLACGVTLGQLDNFQDGTTDSWGNGGQAPAPANISTGGPAGVNDRFLQVTSDGSGSGGRLTVFNRSQWLGDYIAAGVNEIDMDLRNFSTTVTLSIRLAFKSSTVNGAPGYLSQAITLAPSSGWQHVSFLITPATMIPIGSPTSFSTFFTGPAELRIINEAGTSNLNGDPVIAQLGVDNILAIPEPSTLALLLFGAIPLYRRLR